MAHYARFKIISGVPGNGQLFIFKYQAAGKQAKMLKT